jgi:tRNA A37 threonylcarbamoyladenosine dehydratase
MRIAVSLLGVLASCAPLFAQNFPTSLVSNEGAIACTDPTKIRVARLGLGQKDPSVLRRTGCRRLKGGMQVSVEYAEPVGNEDYHLIRVSWHRGPALWSYSYDFKHP